MKANVFAVLLFFLVLSNAASAVPDYCPVVKIDQSGNIVVNDENFFPIGFWSFYSWGLNKTLTETLKDCEYSKYFNYIIHDTVFVFDYITDPDVGNKVKMISQSALKVEDGGLKLDTLGSQYTNPNIIGWELYPEPNNFTDIRGNVSLYSSMIRSSVNDPCGRNADNPYGRLVSITPTITGAQGQYLADQYQYVDIAQVQAGSRLPRMDVKYVGESMQAAANNMRDKPAILVLEITGYQPDKYRNFEREPTIDEIRVQAYDSIIHEAKGVVMYAFRKSDSDIKSFEPTASDYSILDSSKLFEGIKNFGMDIQRHSNIFFSPFSTGISITPPDKINCRAWDVAENGRTANYVICANVAEETSQYFEYTDGHENMHLKAHFFDSAGNGFPAFECNDSIDNDWDNSIDYPADSDCISAEDDEETDSEYGIKTTELSTDKLNIAVFSTGVTNENKRVNKFTLNFDTLPQAGISFKYAIYSDGKSGYVNSNPNEDQHFDPNRDQAPDTKIIIEDEVQIPGTGLQEFALPNGGIELEHTRTYFLLIQISTPGVKVYARDVRIGPKSLENNFGFLNLTGQAPVVRKGKTIAGQLGFSGITANKYCVQKQMGTGYELKNLQSGSIAETFGPYAVHIYKFADYIGNEICDSLDNDCDAEIDEGNVCAQECIKDITPYIYQWKQGRITMLTLMQNMRLWKAGTGC